MNGRYKIIIPILFFIAALIHSTIWSFVTPLWQIPDEAAHYEYVRLMVKLGRLPTPGDEDATLQAEILRSMWENHYWEYLGFKRPQQPPKRILPGGWISGGAIPDTAVIGDAYIYAFSNLGNSQPVYYAMLAPVQAAVVDWPIGDQLRILRAASRFIFACAVMLIVLTAMELFGTHTPFVVGTGLLAVLQPMFAYIGSGVNNDVGVAFAVALLALQVVAAWRRGFSWQRTGLLIITAVAAIYTKRTAVFVLVWLPVAMVTWWLVHMDGKHARRMLIGATAIGIVAMVAGAALYLIPGTVPSNWNASDTTRPAWTSREAHSGTRAFQLAADVAGHERSIVTSVNRPIGMADGSPVFFSAWVKADETASGAAAGVLRIRDDTGVSAEQLLSATNQWQPVTVTLNLSPNASRLVFTLAGTSTAPVDMDDLRAVVQATQTIELPLPNPSAEIPTPLLAQVIVFISRPLGLYGPAVRAVQNYRANIAALPERLQVAASFLNTSFWGKFGIFARARNPQVSAEWGTLLALLVVLSLVGSVIQLMTRRRQSCYGGIVALFLLGVAFMLLQTFAPLLSFAAEGLWLPQGRYLFSGMALLAPALVFGWVGWSSGKLRWMSVMIIGITFAALTFAMIQMAANFFAS